MREIPERKRRRIARSTSGAPNSRGAAPSAPCCKCGIVAHPFGRIDSGSVLDLSQTESTAAPGRCPTAGRRDGLSGRAVQRCRPRPAYRGRQPDDGRRRCRGDRARPRPALSGRGSDQSGEPGLGRARRRAGAAGGAGLAGVPDEGAERGRRDRCPQRREPAGPARLPAGDWRAPRAAIGPAGRHRRPLARAHELRRQAHGAAALRPGRSSTGSCSSTAAIRAAARRRSAPTWAPGHADLGFRNRTAVLFDIAPSRDVTLRVRDERGRPTTASFVIEDKVGRVYPARVEAARAGLLLPEPDLSRRRRERASS